MRSQHIRKTVKTEKNKDDALIFRFSLLEASSVQLRREKLCVFNRGGSLGSSSLWLLSSACKYVWCTTGISARAGLKCWVHMKCRLISTVTQCENTQRGDGLRNTQRWRWRWIYPGRKKDLDVLCNVTVLMISCTDFLRTSCVDVVPLNKLDFLFFCLNECVLFLFLRQDYKNVQLQRLLNYMVP